MITELTGAETAQDFTKDLRYRIDNNESYENYIPYKLLPLEPYVIVDIINESYTNYRAIEYDGKFYIPIAKYTNMQRDEYTMFHECFEWSLIYGINNIYVGVFNNIIDNE